MEKPSDHFAKLLRAESRLCQTANGAAILQEVAAWLNGETVFEERHELWETVDMLADGQATEAVR